LTSFTLWGKKNDVNTAVAGEIIENQNGNNITVQLPADTPNDAAIPYTFTFTGVADTILKDDVQIDTDAEIWITPKSSAKLTVIKDGISKDYTISFVLKPYFTIYDSSNQCIQDLDGNVWVRSSLEAGAVQDTWQGDMLRIPGAGDSFKGFSACNIPAGKWNLPSLEPAPVLLDKLPLAYRSKPVGSGNLEPTDWFNQHNFQLTAGWNYWTSQRNKAIPDNAYAISISKQNTGIYSTDEASMLYPLPFSSGDGNSAKTITSFVLSPENSAPLDATIVGNQIFVKIPMWVNPGSVLNSNISISTTGGSPSSNGVPLTSNNNFALNIIQPTPITITAKNGDRNIYTLIVDTNSVMPPVEKPNVPGLITMCTSSTSLITQGVSHVIIATVGKNFYKQVALPPPGTCSTIDMGTSIRDSDTYSVMWWSFTNEVAVGMTVYADQSSGTHDVIPKFKLTPTTKRDPSGYDLSFILDPACHHVSPNSSNVTPSCTN